MALLPVAEALARVVEGATPTEAETVPLAEARGRVLAADVAAKYTQPPFDASAMDGYAVRREDVANLPATLQVIGESAAGRGFHEHVGKGQAVRIFTGAPVPEGADAIVLQENTSGGGATIVINEGSPEPGHVRRRGGDFTAGQVLLHAGQKLDARTLTIAAAMGHAGLSVRRRPRVAILATGDELVLPDTEPGRDQIIASNPFGVAAIVEAAGGEAMQLGIARDDRADLAVKIAQGAAADVLVTIGGASVGDHDLVAVALKERGFEPGFWKVALRPGKPLLFGRLGPQRVIGLPGNPVSALVCSRIFLVPLLRRMLGTSEPEVMETAKLTHPLEANGPRDHYMRAKLNGDRPGFLTVTAGRSQDSSLLSQLASANCLIVRPANAPALGAGADVDVLRLDF